MRSYRSRSLRSGDLEPSLEILGWTRRHRSGTSELPRSWLLLRSKLLLRYKLLGLLGELLRLLSELLGLLGKLLGCKLGLSLLKVGGKGVNLSVTVLIPGESLQGNVFQSQLGCGDLGRRGWLLPELLLGSKLLGSKLLLLLRCKLLLLLRGKLLLRNKLLLLLRSELLLLLRSKLLLLLELLELLFKSWPLLLLGSKLLLLTSKLLLLLELLEVLVETLSVELLRSGLIGVELSSVEHRSSLSSALVGKLTSLQSSILLLHNSLLLRNDALLMRKDSIVTLFLQLKIGTQGNRFWGSSSCKGSAGLTAGCVGREPS